jgi:hypothetical protein
MQQQQQRQIALHKTPAEMRMLVTKNERVGAGAFGEVFKIVHRKTGRQLAGKVKLYGHLNSNFNIHYSSTNDIFLFK